MLLSLGLESFILLSIMFEMEFYVCARNDNTTNVTTYLCLRKCKLNAKKANAKATPTLARQVTARKAAGATVTTLNLPIRTKVHTLCNSS